MNWQEAIKHYKIQKMYHLASLHANFLSPEVNQFGIKWLKATERPSLYLYGNPGCGKTFFMIALLRHLIESGNHSMIFTRSDHMDKELLDASLGNLMNIMGYRIYETEVIEKYSEVPILFIDDLGTEKDSDRIRQQYGKIIDERVGNGLTTVYTSNLHIEQIGKTLGDRIASRLQVSRQIKFRDEDFRKKISLFHV